MLIQYLKFRVSGHFNLYGKGLAPKFEVKALEFGNSYKTISCYAKVSLNQVYKWRKS